MGSMGNVRRAGESPKSRKARPKSIRGNRAKRGLTIASSGVRLADVTFFSLVPRRHSSTGPIRSINACLVSALMLPIFIDSSRAFVDVKARRLSSRSNRLTLTPAFYILRPPPNRIPARVRLVFDKGSVSPVSLDGLEEFSHV